MRAIAARALGILGDSDSADALAELVKADKEYLVRIRAVERQYPLALLDGIADLREDRHDTPGDR